MTKHLPRLDSLRGMAALMVGGFHSGLAGLTIAGINWSAPLGFFFDGRTGVSIFFVLSGLVLGMSLRRDGNLTPGVYGHFLVRRFFRIYPAFFVSTLIYLLLYMALKAVLEHGLPIGHGWMDYYYDGNHSFKPWTVIKNFLFADQSLNIASWTLKVEAQAALVFPLLHGYSTRFRAKGHLLLLAALIAVAFLPDSAPTRSNLFLFYLGYLLPAMLETLQARRVMENRMMVNLMLLTSLGALGAAHLFKEPGTDTRVGLVLAAAGSTLLLILILAASSHPVFCVFDQPVVKFLGMVSYSFYLYNLFAVDLVSRALFFAHGADYLPPFGVWLLTFVGSSCFGLLLSAGSFYWIERPGIKLGTWLWPQRVRA